MRITKSKKINFYLLLLGPILLIASDSPPSRGLTVTSAHQFDSTAAIDSAERQRVVDAVIANLKDRYPEPETAQKISDSLVAHLKSGEDDAADTGPILAKLITDQMRSVSGDRDLEVVYSQDVLHAAPSGPQPGPSARYREAMKQSNCTFEKVEMRAHNIGFLKLNAFPQTLVCRETAVDVMQRLNNADALIIDLRDNGGGYGEMVSLLAAYLFDHPEYMYNPRENATERSWTESPVPGSKLADKPVYILTSGSTWSAAEQFTYDLKMLKRATIVGETTRGGAHAGVFHRIDDHFGMGMREVHAINPYAKHDWEGTGIEPDVRVKAADALTTAETLAQARLAKKAKK